MLGSADLTKSLHNLLAITLVNLLLNGTRSTTQYAPGTGGETHRDESN